MRRVALLASLLSAACQAADASGSAAGDQAISAKMNLYVQCVNDVSRQVFDGRDFYRAHRAQGAGPDELVAVLTDRCVAGIERAAGMKPPLEAMERAAAAYKKALVTLRPLVAEAHGYYERGAFRDDGGAQGRTLHPLLEAAWDELEVADRALRREMEKVQKEIDARDLARLEQGGGLELHSRRVVTHAEALVRALVDDERSHPGALADYLAALDALGAYLAEHPAARGEVTGPHAAFTATARSLLDDARALAGGTGSVDAVVDEYNRMVGHWNMLTWKR